ncbi:MAG TPA: hypothetical protein PK668_27625 [Myxococcota bacterium]|nr:hypothetical protein [Myxococcota bacterium]HRY95439.1 hypothetical protein [Myxococcota bacterium]HSA23503.1 hypothetical protein [Myxococcota bacterium]
MPKTPQGFRALLACVAAFILALGGPARAAVMGPIPHELDPVEQQLDHTPPGPVQVLSVEVHRGEDPDQSGCGWDWTEDAELGSVVLRIAPPEDDRTPPERMGYRIERVGGTVPAGLLPDFDVRGLGDVIYLHWEDGGTDEQEPLDFDLTIRAVDLGGNVGPSVGARNVTDPGTGGCATTSPSLAGLLALLAGLLALRRRNPR